MPYINIPGAGGAPTGATIIEKWRRDTEQYRKDAKVRLGRALVPGFVEPTLEDYIDEALTSLSAQLARQQAVVEAARRVEKSRENDGLSVVMRFERWRISRDQLSEALAALDAASTKEQET